MGLRERLDADDGPLTLYEVIPPAKSVPEETVEDTTYFLRGLLAEQHVDAINIPEVRSEEGNGRRVAGYMEKLDPRRYGQMLRTALGDETEVIVNHVGVHEPPKEQEAWMMETLDGFGYRDLVVVGGESSDVDYPGLHPPQLADLAWQVASDLGVDDEVALGGITLPARAGEVERVLAKQDHGIRFFTSQVIFEAEPTKALLRDYAKACADRDVEPATFFLSFAPVTGKKDAEFLRWLGVEIPPAAEAWILAPSGRTLQRSVRVAEHVLREVLTYVDRRGIDVPVGLNVEHVMRYNFEASEVLLDQLTSLMEWVELERGRGG